MFNNILSRLTKNAQKALEDAQFSGQEKDWKKIDGFFLFEALLKRKNCLGNVILKKYYSNKKLPQKKIGFSVFEILAEALHLAALTKSSHIGTEHLANSFLILKEKKELSRTPQIKNIPAAFQKNSASKNSLFPNNEAFQPDFFQDINSLIEGFFSGQAEKGKSGEFLKRFCLNLNEQVAGENYTLIGREAEIERISHILARKNKNNPVLVGDPGVGKTAIIEGLAEKINRHCADFQLNDKKILSLDLGLLLAGTNFRGEFELRLKEIIAEAKKNRRVILFIDEIHTLVGAGNAMGGMDAANLLKPALSRGEIQVIGATTLDEYQKYIEKDAALERRFQPIFVNEPTTKETEKILLGIKKFYEAHHRLTVPDQLIGEIVRLAKEYLPEKFLPDSAIDLLDEASARRRSLLAGKELYEKLSQSKSELEKLIQQKEFLVVNESYEEAIRLREKEKQQEGKIKLLEKELIKIEKKSSAQLQKEDLWQVLSRSARIPLELLAKKDQDLVSFAIQKLKTSLVGQKEAVEKIEQTLLRQFSGLGNPQRPLGSFLFIGAAGVGKTLTAKILAENLSPLGKGSLIQINMGELAENHSVSRLLGAPAGYVGYEESSELKEKLRRNPYSVVLFDELEKAGPAAINLLLRILEEGILTDAKGKQIDFRHSVIVLTSNFAVEELTSISQIGFSQKETLKEKAAFREMKKNILKEAESFFPKELLDRLDHILVFNNLSQADLKEVARKEIDQLKNRLKNKNITLVASEEVLDFIAQKSFQPQQGGRVVRKTIQNEIELLLAKFLLENHPNGEANKKNELFCQIYLDKKNKPSIKKIVRLEKN